MLWWRVMNISALQKPGLLAAAAAVSAMVAIGVPLALAAPTAAPPSDAQGYVDSTARCATPDTAVLFGTTTTSRVAICQIAGGEFEYRGVRVRDGAKLIAAASQTSDGGYVVKNDGVTYTITTTSLSVSMDGSTVRTESWTDFHNPQSPATSGTTKTTATSTTTSATTSATTSSSTSATTSASASPTTSGTASASSSASPSTAAATPQTSAAQSSSAVPLPPPLPAEVGSSTSAR